MRLSAIARGWWQGLFVLVLPVTLVVALLPLRLRHDTFEHTDKLMHVGAFMGLAVLAALAWPGRQRVVFTGLIAYGVLVEVLQSFFPPRAASMADVVADGLGIALGLLLSSWLFKRL